MPNWTDEQLNAINAYGYPVIVSAAAGSGKTAVLVERIIRLLADSSKNIKADKLLAVTFTNDAAAQMREKLSAAFEKLLIDSPDDTWLLKQHSLLRLAEVTTINAFCYNFVKDHLELTDFQSGVRIMEKNESDMLTERALTAVLERRYSEMPDETEKLVQYFCRENDRELRGILIQLYAFLRTLPYRDAWINSNLTALRDGSALETVCNDSKEAARRSAFIISNMVHRMTDMCDSLDNFSKDVAVLKNNGDIALRLCETVDSSDWDTCVNAFNGISWQSRQGARQSKAEKEACSYSEIALHESAVMQFEEIKKNCAALAKIYKYPTAVMNDDALLVADIFESLCDICRELDENLHQVKVEKNAFDFADTELITVAMLTYVDESGKICRTPLCEEIVASQKYSLIVLDEFQDVNNLQDVIFKALSDTEDISLIGKNVFVVGDAKQAIYRFRRANPMIFVNTRRAAHRDDNDVKEVTLTKNFRSRRRVLEFSNYIFSQLMNPEMGEIDYNDSERLNLGADYPGDDCDTEIILINSDIRDDDDDDDGVYPDEFKAVARRIRRLIDEGTLVKDGDSTRPCRAGDFCVLTRNNIADPSLAASFESVGLKIASADRSGYLASREISLLLNILSCICSPMKDVPMASVMLSPIMCFSDDELALVKLVAKKSRLYKNMLMIAHGEKEASDELKAKCINAVALVKRLRIYSSQMNLVDLIKTIYDTTDIFGVASAYEDGAQKRANLHLLLEYAAAYSESSSDGVAGFLRYVKYVSDSGGDFEKAFTVTESDNAVTVKTIHKSKGLEYPFVFICQTKRQFNRKDLQGMLNLNYDVGVGINFLDKSRLVKHTTVFSDYVKRKNESEMLSEELRLLYVALTRAKERLFIVLNSNQKTLKHVATFAYSFEPNSSKISTEISSKARCSEDWLYMTLMKHPDISRIFNGVIPEEMLVCGSADTLPKIQVSLPEIVPNCEPRQRVQTPPDDSLTQRIKNNFESQARLDLPDTLAKVTVTELIKENYVDFFEDMPDFTGDRDYISPAERGTLTHKFMQLCDFDAAAHDLESEISRLSSLGHFTAHQTKGIDRRSVGAFFKSKVFARMHKSQNIMREKQFLVDFKDITLPDDFETEYKGTRCMLQGIADCLFEEDDGYVLVDYKTDKVNTLEELVARYSSQLALYKAAFATLLDKPIKSACIYSFRLADDIEVKL